MARRPPPPLATVVSFIDCINRGDLDGLAQLVHPGHRLEVLDEEPLVGWDANVEAWRGYFAAFPDYVIYPSSLVESGTRIAVLGTTTGSHLRLPDAEERSLEVIWLADVDHGLVTRWAIREATDDERHVAGLPPR